MVYRGSVSEPGAGILSNRAVAVPTVLRWRATRRRCSGRRCRVPALLAQRHRQVHLPAGAAELLAEEVRSRWRSGRTGQPPAPGGGGGRGEDQQHQAFRVLRPVVRAEDLDVRPASCT